MTRYEYNITQGIINLNTNEDLTVQVDDAWKEYIKMLGATTEKVLNYSPMKLGKMRKAKSIIADAENKMGMKLNDIIALVNEYDEIAKKNEIITLFTGLYGDTPEATGYINILIRNGIRTVEELVNTDIMRIAKFRNCGSGRLAGICKAREFAIKAQMEKE